MDLNRLKNTSSWLKSYSIKLRLLPDQIMKASDLQSSNLVGKLVVTKDKPYHKNYLMKKMFK